MVTVNTGYLISINQFILVSSNDKAIYLCEGTKITIYERTAGKSYFTIMDGNSGFVGLKAWISIHNEKYLTTVPPPSNAATVTIKYDGSPVWENSPIKGHLLQLRARFTTGNGIFSKSYT